MRNPTDRAYSHYWTWLKHRKINNISFEECIERYDEILEIGKYVKYIERFQEIFSRILVVSVNKYVNGTCFDEIYRFLDVKPIKTEILKKNRSGIYKNNLSNYTEILPLNRELKDM